MDQWIQSRQNTKKEESKSPEQPADDGSDQSMELPQGIKDQITDL